MDQYASFAALGLSDAFPHWKTAMLDICSVDGCNVMHFDTFSGDTVSLRNRNSETCSKGRAGLRMLRHVPDLDASEKLLAFHSNRYRPRIRISRAIRATSHGSCGFLFSTLLRPPFCAVIERRGVEDDWESGL